MTAEKLYYLNGRLKRETEQKKEGGAVLVVAKSYHDNGQLEFSGRFTERKRWANFGYGSYWDYREQNPEGEHRWYRADGTAAELSNYRKGKREGLRVRYYDDGKHKKFEELYRDDHLVRRKEYNKSGKLKLDEEYFEDGSRKQHTVKK